MPTPLDLLLDPATQTLFAMFGGLLLWDPRPARPLPHVRGWTLRALAAFALYFLLSSYLPLLWAETLAPLQLFDLSGWPTGPRSRPACSSTSSATLSPRDARPRRLAAFHQMHHSSGGSTCSARSGSARSTWSVDAAAERDADDPRRAAGSGDDDAPRVTFCRCSSTPTCARRAGSATSCSAPRATRSTMHAGSTATTTPTCRFRPAVRHLPQSAPARARHRLLARRLGPHDRHAAAARRFGAEPLIYEHRKENSRWHRPAIHIPRQRRPPALCRAGRPRRHAGHDAARHHRLVALLRIR